MKPTKLAFILDMIVSRAVMGILIFIWCRYFVNSLPLALLISVLILAGVSALIEVFMRPVRRRKRTLEEQAEKASMLNRVLMFRETSYALDFFCKALGCEYSVAVKEKCLLLEKEGDLKLFYPYYTGQKLTCSELTAIVVDSRKYGASKLTVACGEGSLPTVSAFAASVPDMKIKLMSGTAAYNLLCGHDALPPLPSKQKRNYKEIPLALKKAFFHRKRAKGYILSSLMILLSSMFVRLSVYYLVFASFLLAMSLACFFSRGEINEPEQV